MADGSEKKEKDAQEEKISLLTNIPGVGLSTAKLLAESGYNTIKKVSEADKVKLAAKVSGLSEAKAEAVIGDASDLQKKIDSGEIDLGAKSKSKKKKAPEPEPDKKDLSPVEETIPIPEEVVSLLTNIPGVGPRTAEKLAESGFDTIKKVSEGDKVELAAAVTGLSEAKADAVIGEAFDLQEKIDSGEIDLTAKAKSKRKKAAEPDPDKHELPPIEEITRAEERKNLVTGYDLDKAAIGVAIGPKWLTKYERARIIGARALQIAMGAPIMIDIKMAPKGRYSFAEQELRSGALPMTVRRHLPTGEFIDVPLTLLLKHTKLE